MSAYDAGVPRRLGRTKLIGTDISHACRSAELLRTRSIIHRRGDSFSSLRSDDDVGDVDDFEQRPLFFMHGVGLGLVRDPLFVLPHAACANAWGLP